MSDVLLESAGDEADDQLAEGVEQLVRSIKDRTADFARREERVQELEGLLDAQRIRVDRLEAQLREADERAVTRDRQLNERERELDLREAKLAAEEEIRLDKLERSEAFVEELRSRLEARETQFNAQMGVVQADLRRRDVSSLTRAANAREPLS
jgi:formate dehydrogenase maturation protein FdhE